MATRSYYQLSYPSILLYYNLLGVDMRAIDINHLETEIDDLNDLAPKELYYGLPKISQLIDKEYLEMVEKICNSPEWDKFKPGAKKQMYMESVNRFLNTATSLNLMEEGRENYILHFHRLSTVILLVLQELNKMRIYDVIHFSILIEHSSSNEVWKKAKFSPFLSIFCYLAMNDNTDIEDYKMFEDENSSQIKIENLWELMTKNVHNNSDYICLRREFKRLSYLESKEMELNK